MNKLLTGAVAGAAGVALLLGGAGTFALWNSTAGVNVGTVSSGVLTIAQSGKPAWTDNSIEGTSTPIKEISSFRIVPGDKIQLTQDLTIAATGDNLRAELSYDATKVMPTADADKALASDLEYTFDATGGTVERISNTDRFLVTPTDESSIVTVTATIALPAENVNKLAQNGTIDLSKMAVTLKQTR